MKQRKMELVGILVTHSKTYNKYRIDYVQELTVGGILVEGLIQKGFDFNLHVSFEEIVRDLTNAYGPALDKRWRDELPHAHRVLLAFRPGLKPESLHIGKAWKMDMER